MGKRWQRVKHISIMREKPKESERLRRVKEDISRYEGDQEMGQDGH